MYSNQELAEIHFMYGKADGNAALARRLYQERYPQRQCLDRKTFQFSLRLAPKTKEARHYLFSSQNIALRYTPCKPQIYRQLKEVYGDTVMNERNVRKWCEMFNNGRTNVHDETRPDAHHFTEDLKTKVNDRILQDRRTSLDELHIAFPDISRFLLGEIVSQHLGYHKICARPHTAASTRELLDQFGWEIFDHPPYSPDLAPSDFHLFTKLKDFLGGTRFGSDEELKKTVNTWLNELAAEEYNTGILKLVNRYDKYLNSPLCILCYFKVNDVIDNPADCEVRSVIRYLNARHLKPAEIYRQLKEVYGDTVMNERNVRKWYEMFNNGRTNVHDEIRPGHLSLITENLKTKVNDRILQDRRTSLDELHIAFPDISRSLLGEIVSQHLGYHKICARRHTAASTRELLDQFGWEIFDYSPYSPDLAPSDFHLFTKLKDFLGGMRFGSDEELKKTVNTWLNELAAEEYNMGILKLVNRYDKCLNVGGDYVEK
ncbi:hypothetical protein ANN_16161 [Periplaneta americana]|uniref:Mos1 transposase HTH domain-containing protein n=1 Tax=Periplaneta americana TaxID=6978 RepID=A0ABQ8SIZ3_PERAM|nr:hypothetical protein ANN_16161 [Periplaneta americana]